MFRIDGPSTTAVFHLERHVTLVSFGRRLARDTDLSVIAGATMQGLRESQPDFDPGLTLLPQAGHGFSGEPAIALPGFSNFEPVDVETRPDRLVVTYRDEGRHLLLRTRWEMLPSGLLSSAAEIENAGRIAIPLEWLAALSLPLPDWAGEALQVHGHWGAEFQLAGTRLQTRKVEKVNRTGRSGFDGAHYAIAHEGWANETVGKVVAAHLAWSGNCRSFIETLPTGERQLQMGEWLAPGEIILRPGERYSSPEALLVCSEAGFNGVRSAFHAEARTRQRASEIGTGPRKVHFNSWEAVYFDLDEKRLFALAQASAAIGAERFVLDDGWFKGRRDDHSSLGDWFVDLERFPRGLTPLIEHVASLGMDFGLWVEPEMVSADSDLYRSHPDWCLHAGAYRPTQRHQLVLDLTRADVREHLWQLLDTLLRNHGIAYLKWDHNRDLFPAISGGESAAHRQTLGFYEVVDRLRALHPRVEIESCASGGGRVDFGMMTRAARFWASDNTDAVERLRIQRAMSLFYPLQMIGSHVGAAPNPTTGRSLDMAFRARVAMFAHFGVEADPEELSDHDRATLKAHAALYKKWRGLLHSGDTFYGSCADPDITIMTVSAPDRSQALTLVARATQSGAAIAPAIHIPGLNPTWRYRVSLLEPWPEAARKRFTDPAFWERQPVIDGATLGDIGVQLHVVRPETAWLIHLAAVPQTAE
ncbi:alpha-galactosidase [Sphingomonas sp. BN140010]|uniref:alpha-galactosidase n=1 Tax=Sphingomonas arvum TaxID=2992113 RepID=A0ABT3JD06_9SPHN|nr:alpha-galactosidase [Sphingomonas sp. BN140010]